MTGSEDAALRRQASQHLQRRTAALRPLAARRDLVRCSSQALRARQGKSSRGTTEAVTNSGRHAPPASSAAVRCIPDHHPCIHLLAQMRHFSSSSHLSGCMGCDLEWRPRHRPCRRVWRTELPCRGSSGSRCIPRCRHLQRVSISSKLGCNRDRRVGMQGATLAAPRLCLFMHACVRTPRPAAAPHQ